MLIYTDGGCRGGVGAWAWWCETTDESSSGVETPSTNQRMELRAVLSAVTEYYTSEQIVIMSDSAYVVNCFGERWFAKWLKNGWIGNKGPVINRDLWEPLLKVVIEHGNVKFIKVKAHSGNTGNQIVDNICTERILKHQKEMQDARATTARSDEADPPSATRPISDCE